MDTKTCQPKSSYSDCSCSKLFDGLLRSQVFEDISHLRLMMAPSKDDYMAACRCYLGASSRAEFTSVEIKDPIMYKNHDKCNGKRVISIGSYAKICENELAPNTCEGYWDITKS